MKKRVLIFGTITVVLLAILVIWFNATIDLMNLDSNEVAEIVVFNGNTGKETRITDETQMEKIINNLNDIEMKRWKSKRSFFYTVVDGSIDYDYIASIVD